MSLYAYRPTDQQCSRLPALDVGDTVQVLSPPELAGQVETVRHLLALKRTRGRPARWFLVLEPSGRVVSPRTVRAVEERR